MLRKLKDSEMNHALAAYLEKEVAKNVGPIEEMDAAAAILPDDINIVLDPEKVPAKSGYCMLENGGSYTTVITEMPGVTKEMLQWMVAWQGQDPVNYMALNPETHHSAAISDVDRAKTQIPFLTIDQKAEGIFVYSVNEIGGALEGDITAYLSPMDIGFCMDKYTKQDNLVLGGYEIRQAHEDHDPNHKTLDILLHVIADTADGVTVQTHLWAGYKILRREVKRFDNNGIQPTPEYVAMMAQYIADEMAQIANVLPDLYQATEGAL